MSMFMAQHQYAYPASPPSPRQYSGHGTSSAFSSSANPDEDWTKISDLAERRRIQNRIAQRNYRKKLKRRLEDLERRAGSSDEAESEKQSQGSSVSLSSTTDKSPSSKSVSSRRSSKSSQKSQATTATMASAKPVAQAQFTPPMEANEEFMFANSYEHRGRSHTPPMFTYSSYPAPDELLMDPYRSAAASAPQYHPAMTAADAYPSYMAPAATTGVPVTLPSVTHFTDAVKREAYPSDDGLSNPYMSYGFVPGLEVGMPSPYDSNPQTPPLSHSFDHSANCSDAGYEYPTTPLSMPGSPGLLEQLQGQ